jgi:hypothetical protein
VTKRQSITPTYDSRETGPRYHVTTRINDRTIGFEKPITDPFVRQTVHVGTRDLLRSLFRRRLEVVVIVGGDRDVVEDVLELDAEWLGGDSTRRDEFTKAAFSSFLVDAELAEIVDGDGDD